MIAGLIVLGGALLMAASGCFLIYVGHEASRGLD